MLQCTGSLFFQIKFILHFLPGKQSEELSSPAELLISLMYLIINILVMILIVISKWRDNKLNLVYLQVLGLLLTSHLLLLDFEGKRFDEKLSSNKLIMLLIWTIIMLGVCFNFLITKKIFIYIGSVTSSFLCILGTSIMERKL